MSGAVEAAGSVAVGAWAPVDSGTRSYLQAEDKRHTQTKAIFGGVITGELYQRSYSITSATYVSETLGIATPTEGPEMGPRGRNNGVNNLLALPLIRHGFDGQVRNARQSEILTVKASVLNPHRT